jgi:hypothetical protein
VVVRSAEAAPRYPFPFDSAAGNGKIKGNQMLCSLLSGDQQ